MALHQRALIVLLSRGVAVAVVLCLLPSCARAQTVDRPRARDLGIVVGIFPAGEHNAITDVAGVRVGHTTVQEGDTVNTGVTAVLPHGEEVFWERVPAAIYLLNGLGKLIGYSQVKEHGELETPILLTGTLNVWKAADAMANYYLQRPGMEQIRSINPVVGETNDGSLSDSRTRQIRREEVIAAIENARGGSVAEGTVGAGTGTRSFGWKAGIGTSSRTLPPALGGYTVGVLVQSNFGGILTINGAPVGRELGRYSFQQIVEGQTPEDERNRGSIMIVVATDAPLSPFNLERLAKRVAVGLGRTGSFVSDNTGDFIIAFSTAPSVRRRRTADHRTAPYVVEEVDLRELPYNSMAGLYAAVVEAAEEAIYNSLFRSTPVTYRGNTMPALPIEQTVEILKKYNVLNWDERLGQVGNSRFQP